MARRSFGAFSRHACAVYLLFKLVGDVDSRQIGRLEWVVEFCARLFLFYKSADGEEKAANVHRRSRFWLDSGRFVGFACLAFCKRLICTRRGSSFSNKSSRYTHDPDSIPK